MEGLSTVCHFVRLGDWFTKIDLNDAYLTVPVCAKHQKFLHFSWKGINYKFTTLAFDLSPAPWAFAKLLQLANKKHWHSSSDLLRR